MPTAHVRLGFVALNDCAPLVIASERGHFRRHGLSVELVREPSWANIRDKVCAGLLEGAQMLAPIPIATTLGIDGTTAPIVVPLSLGMNGNAVTVSTALYERMRRADPAATSGPRHGARALLSVIREDRAAGRRPLRFGVVFPFSAHYYELVYWAASVGIDPTRDLEISVVPPSSMAEGLRSGHIDGYCVGEPWNQLAVEWQVGRTVVTKYDIWSNSPEKVLGLRAEWAARNPEACRALVRALVDAARWIDAPENRLETVHVVAGTSFVDAPVAVAARAFLGRPLVGEGVREMPDFHVFHRYAATFPWVSHAMWYATQMIRWGQVEKPFCVRALAQDVYRPDLYREAAEEAGEPAPEVDEKVEGRHAAPWLLEGVGGSIRMGPDRFHDGRVFDPSDVVSYLEQSEVSRLRLRLDDLAVWNA